METSENNDRRSLLMRAALAPAPAAHAAFCQWFADNVGASHDHDPIALRWLPLVAWNLRDESLHESEAAYLRDIQRILWAANLRLVSASTAVLARMTAAGVRLMLLKGAALGLTVYDAQSVRALGDIDVLVPPEQVALARDILTADGWRTTRHANVDDLVWCHATGWERPPVGALDLHWHLFPECCWPDADTRVWTRAKPVSFADRPMLVPSAADQLLHVCVHGLRWSPVQSDHWMADAVHIIRHDPEALEWDVLLDEAQRRGLTVQTEEALRRVRDIGYAQVPAAVLRQLTATRPSWRERLECRVKTRPVVSAGGMFLLWCGWRRARAAAEGRGPEWLRYLAASVGVPSRWHLVPWALRHIRSRIAALAGSLVPGRALAR